MRIVSVRIRNLNSLTGDWTIRLDGAEYESGGIFAITGPTGAGKSTILDAICLALYASTPRLDKVTKSSNEIMSRQASECLAEVRFCTMRGEYVCSWSQKRTGKRAAGEFQQPRHRLYDSEGRALAENTKAVLAKVEELTGMDFARFTQSMLLAQGHFASFLLADGDKRAPLLEKITGKGIYTEISKKVHERNREESLKLDALDRELAARNLLSLEEEESLMAERNALQERSAALSEKEKALSRDMTRVEQAEALERDTRALAADKDALEAEKQAFEPQQAILARAMRAAALSPALEALGVRREEERLDRERKAALSEELPRLESAEKAATEALTEAKNALAAEKTAVESARETWKKVRAADTELAARRSDMTALEKELEGRNAELESKNTERQAAEQAHRKALEELEALAEEKKKREADAALAEATGSLQMRLSLLGQEERALAEAGQALKEHEKILEERETSLAGRRRSAEALARALAEAQEKLNEARKNFAALLGGKDAAFHRARRNELFTRRSTLEKALESAKSRAGQLARAADLALREKELDLAVQKEEGELALLRERLSALREKLALEAKIRSYEEERKNLREGSPCPLCGATHHPFACDAPALPDASKNALDKLEKETEQLSSALAGHKSDAVHARESREEAEKAAADQTDKLRQFMGALSRTLSAALSAPLPDDENAASDIYEVPSSALRSETARTEGLALPTAWENEILSALTLTNGAPTLAPLLARFIEEDSAELDRAEALLKSLDEKEAAGRTLAENAEKLRRLHEEAQNAVQTEEKEALRLGTEKTALEKDLAEKERKAEASRDELRRGIAAFGEKGDSTPELTLAVNALAQRRDRYAALTEKEARAREKLAELARVFDMSKQALSAAENEQKSAVENRNRRAADLAGLERARMELFGTRNVDEEEKAANESLRAREEQEEKSRNALETSSRALADARRDDAALQERLARHARAIADMEKGLAPRLAAEGFENESDCRLALLDEATLDSLDRTRQSLEQKAAGLDARAAELARRRKEQILPLPSREETERALAESRAEREETLRRLGSLQEKLHANDEQKKQAEQLRQQRGSQVDICRRWAALNELIGSADGKKFRNYAQELTFRRLILMANRQLAFMTDRYLLSPSRDEALTLNVIDRYQADAVRSSRNLSGGESFLVSLALALGLAQMASRNVRVDSVFLDEGFGTLDEESLGTALDMLSTLRRKGKMIGIISHVQAVRDRVALQIRVAPKGNGKSELSGPGVTRNGD